MAESLGDTAAMGGGRPSGVSNHVEDPKLSELVGGGPASPAL